MGGGRQQSGLGGLGLVSIVLGMALTALGWLSVLSWAFFVVLSGCCFLCLSVWKLSDRSACVLSHVLDVVSSVLDVVSSVLDVVSSVVEILSASALLVVTLVIIGKEMVVAADSLGYLLGDLDVGLLDAGVLCHCGI